MDKHVVRLHLNYIACSQSMTRTGKAINNSRHNTAHATHSKHCLHKSNLNKTVQFYSPEFAKLATKWVKTLYQSLKAVNKVSEERNNFLNLTNSFPQSRSYFIAVFSFRISAQKKRQRIASSSWLWISDRFLASLRCTYVHPSFVVLEMFALGFFFFISVASSSSDNVENFSLLLLLLKSSKGMEKRSKLAL